MHKAIISQELLYTIIPINICIIAAHNVYRPKYCHCNLVNIHCNLFAHMPAFKENVEIWVKLFCEIVREMSQFPKNASPRLQKNKVPVFVFHQ